MHCPKIICQSPDLIASLAGSLSGYFEDRNMWSMVAQRLTQIKSSATTQDQLWQRVEAAWSALPQKHIQSLFESMPRRVHRIGSTVKGCECPSGFEGNKCEKRKDDRRLLAQCVALGCTQTCGLTNHGDYKCTCLTGYHLAEDKKTCIEKGRTRYLIHFKLYDQNVDLAHLDATRYNQLKKGIENAEAARVSGLSKSEDLIIKLFDDATSVINLAEEEHQERILRKKLINRAT
ncbi:uncharacterized protein TNCV_1157311 [Trichonephila clavipes]|nr:uncharacterized protein TNCV_1157311 [Trichonephila clavipes]